MPTVDGIALALKAIRMFPEIRIVMISGYPNERLRAHNLDALAHQILAKPFSLEEIQEAVANALKKG
jgi:DNA-binding NarL/FixJ family response regulator